MSATSMSPSQSATRTPDGPDRVLAFAESLTNEARVDETEVQELETWVTCRMVDNHVAFPVKFIQEIVRPETITRVPHAPYPVRGILNLRGRVIPVVDLRVRLGLPPRELDAQSRIAVTSLQQRMLGLLVDGVEQVVSIDRLKIEDAPADVMTDQSGYIVGVYQHEGTLLILLDVEQVLTVPDGLEAVNATRTESFVTEEAS